MIHLKLTKIIFICEGDENHLGGGKLYLGQLEWAKLTQNMKSMTKII